MTILKADQTAADRILKRATAIAIEFIRAGDTLAAEVVLTTAGFSAAMLLGEGPAS